jgi:hypothetical protein
MWCGKEQKSCPHLSSIRKRQREREQREREQREREQREREIAEVFHIL